MRSLDGFGDLNDGVGTGGNAQAGACFLDAGGIVAQRLQKAGNAVATLGRADEYRRDLARPHFLAQILEYLATIWRNVGQQLFHQVVIIIGEALQHLVAGSQFVGLMIEGMGTSWLSACSR